jgi:hypothetical protein
MKETFRAVFENGVFRPLRRPDDRLVTGDGHRHRLWNACANHVPSRRAAEIMEVLFADTCKATCRRPALSELQDRNARFFDQRRGSILTRVAASSIESSAPRSM